MLLAQTAMRRSKKHRDDYLRKYFPLKTIQKVGLYLDKFVMDAIDTEYFLRIRRHTGKVMLVPAANLKHELGHPLRKQILIWHPMSLNYSPVRTYYIARNFLYLNKQYAEFKRPELLWKLIGSVLSISFLWKKTNGRN